MTMKYEVIINIEVDPSANFLEVYNPSSPFVIKELMYNIMYDIDDVKITNCEVTLSD